MVSINSWPAQTRSGSGSKEASAGEEGDCVTTTADPITDTEPGDEDNTKIKQPNEKKNMSGLRKFLETLLSSLSTSGQSVYCLEVVGTSSADVEIPKHAFSGEQQVDV